MSRAAPMDPDDRRQQLLAAARRVFSARGYHNAGVSHIIAEAGVARGTFYNYFESKRAIFQEVLVELMTELSASVFPIDVHAPIPEQVRENLRRVVRAAMGPEAARLLFAEAVGIDEEGDAALRVFWDRATERVQRALETGQAMGIVRDGDMRLTAECMLGLIKGPIFLAALRGQPLDAEALVDESWRLLSAGVLRAR